MSYLLMQILACLLLAGLIGLFIGWWLRGGCKNKLRDNDEEWNLKLQNHETDWDHKLQGIKSDYASNTSHFSTELEAMKLDLKRTKAEKEEAYVKLSTADDAWNLKLRDAEADWTGKLQGVMSDFDSKSGSNDTELEALRTALAEAKTELSDNNGLWNLKHKDLEANWNNKLQSVMRDYDVQAGSSNTELERLKVELASAKKELMDTNALNSKLKETNSNWEGKLQGMTSTYDLRSVKTDKELDTLKVDLALTKKELSDSNNSWDIKLKETDSNWEGKLQGVLSDRTSDTELETLRVALAEAKTELSDNNGVWNLKHKDLEANWNNKLQGAMRDYNEKGVHTDKELATLKAELASSKKELNDAELGWTGKLQGIMGDYDRQINDADNEIASLKAKLTSTQTEVKTSAQALIDIDKELFEAEGNIQDSYEVTELEGVGPAYGKKFNSMGIKTTGEFADKFLEDDTATKNAATETGIDYDAIKSWASMADLMRLPSVGGQYAEILQAVGISSRKDLTKANAKSLHTKMREYNASHAIVPEVPSLALVLRWAKSPDSSKIAAAIDASPSSMDDMDECYEIEEVEGIGPSYGKKFRTIGINTTCDLAKAYLRNEDATKDAAKNLSINEDAITSWVSMADLMKLPGVGGQFAEIMQTVGVGSRKELRGRNANKLQEKMDKYNAQHAIVPEVPSVEMISTWIKASK